MSLSDAFRTAAKETVAIFAGTLTATFTIQDESLDPYRPSTDSRPTTNQQVYSVPCSPRYSSRQGPDLQNTSEASFVVAALDVEGATLTNGSGTVLAPRVGASVLFSDSSDVWTVTAVQPHQGGEAIAAYEVTIGR